jgi:hypothetical protein
MMKKKEEKGMKPILVNFGLALALSFAGFLYSRLRITRIIPTGRSSGIVSFQFHDEFK